MSTAQEAPTYPALVQDLADRGLLDARWRQVFEAVPRSQFIPPDIWRQLPDRCESVVGTAEWLALVNSDEPVVTQLDDGAESGPGIATSSNSMPSMVARMLGLLGIEDGHRVLEIGTGTGYVAALLSERLGDEQVHSIELDPVLAQQAADAISGSGYRPHLHVGDGAEQIPGMGPVDRLIATCALRYIPYTLLRQVRPGGVIVAPLARDFWSGALVQLHVQADGTAVGPFCGSAMYMPMRSHRLIHHEIEGTGRPRAAGLDPARILDLGFALYAGARLPGVRVSGHGTADGARVWVSSADGAGVMTATGEEVLQYGPGFLWEEIEQAWWEYETAGRPGADQFGLTVTAGGHQVWLRDPHLIVQPSRA
ncbi:methyltransferase domain-containing protein [Streptomyces sp. MBT56]|uniref:methyltransferase domain-containing protein n=1 Tax=unclassified Streptomyces TaxID=2593676 RepID=UPI001909CDD7|nr:MULTISPECIES: methyltransferase domain-containing protein [unclassified Streptomyces]MBK3556316.1 methyltransferase domain-containing protein [Streptomyces sp. MBT56]MBK3601218.1 methyltransferase domain-containing protein [Streptomyces sp. MBT54]MBK3614546.1 methyltransferase domain-containing protein [Streptomyces sp. MBT98]MBK6042809.1 methyltransferase domain-containing protein [Streptomyces sp. MBT55]